MFDVDDGTGNYEQRIKLVRGEILKNDYWNTAPNSNNKYDDWTNTSLKTFLNGDYYNNLGDALENGYGLKESARNMIGDAKYYLGGSDSTGSAEAVYARERGNTICGACGTDITKLIWTGKVGLMYPSDNYLVYGNRVQQHNCYIQPVSYMLLLSKL